MQDKTDVKALALAYHDADGLLLDAYDAKAKGGTGHPFNWDLIPTDCTLPIILAGGLDETNAKHAILSVKPYALDVSSGVEIAKGIKDSIKIAAFIEQVNEGDQVTI